MAKPSQKRRFWQPCRVCGAEHQNPMSSDICSSCGARERRKREREEEVERLEFEASAFGQFMMLPEEERWRQLFERLEQTD